MKNSQQIPLRQDSTERARRTPGDLVNKDTLIQSFGRRYGRLRTALRSTESAHEPVILTSSQLKGNYSCFSVVCALTFHSHGDDKLCPGCTLASVTSPGFSFAPSAAAACPGHLWQNTPRCSLFSLRRVLMGLMRPRTFTSNSPGRKGILQEANTGAHVRQMRSGGWPDAGERTQTYVKSLRECEAGKTPFPMFQNGHLQLGYPGTNVVTFDQHK